MKICNGKNKHCPPECRHRELHECTGEAVRCGYIGSDSQFEIVKCVSVDHKEE